MSNVVWLRALCAAAILASPAALAYAQGAPALSPSPSPLPSPSPSPSVAPQIAHVVTSDRRDESLRSSARTTYVVTKAEMLRHGYFTVAEAIARLPAVKVERDGPGASLATIGIRGSTSAQVLVLIDGAPAPGAQINSVDLASFPTNGVDRIEVVEGGGSTLYGSGSIGGIVNIITTPNFGSVADATVGSFGERTLRIQTPYISFERSLATENYPLPNGTTQPNSDYALTNARVNYNRQIGAVLAQFGAGITDRHQGTPGDYDFPPLSLTARQNDVTRDVHLNFSNTTRATTTTLQLAGSSLDIAYTCSATDPACFTTPQLFADSRLWVSLRADVEHANVRTIYGVDFSRGTARIDGGYVVTSPPPTPLPPVPIQTHPYAQSAAYLQQDWLFKSGSSLYAGLRAERDGQFGGQLSPSIGGILSLTHDLSVRANLAGAFRAPTIDELYYPSSFFPLPSNPHLVSERTRVADLSIDDDALLGGISFTWFSTSGTNLIADNANFTPENIGHASIQGLTLTARTPAQHGIYSKLDVTNLYRAQDLDTDPQVDPLAGMRLPRRGPVFSANLELGYLGNADAFVNSFAISERSEGPRGTVDPTQPLFDQPVAYSLLNAFVRLRVANRALLTLRGYNLGNERYADVAGYPMPGRSFALELSTR
jgi:vitamin B12 transporter